MAALSFTVGPVASAKTVDLILQANQLQGILGTSHVMILKPTVDVRYSSKVVKSATGLEIRITNNISPADNILDLNFSGVQHIFIDEIQFFTVVQIEQLRWLSLHRGINVHCYGLLNDFKLGMFETSRRLLELCDTFIQTKTYCMMCNGVTSQATHNLKICKDGKEVRPVVSGDSVCIGGIDVFLPVCFACYSRCTKSFVD